VRSLQGAPLLVALLVGIGLLPAAVRADTAPPAPSPVPQPAPPRSLVVALTLGSPRLQAGVVRGREVILARGLEIELVRILARRLQARVDGFVYVPTAPRLLASSLAGWQLALGGIEPAGGAGAAGEATRSYLTTDVAVVARRGLRSPRRLADLRGAILCAIRGSESAAVAMRTGSRRAPLLVAGQERLREVLRTGACDAALVPAVEAGRFVAGRTRAFGPVVGRIAHGNGYVALVRRGEGLDVAAVDRELARLARDGTLARLAQTWLGLDPASLRVLR
jgi:ABC-type amino acid transport substrate-binding protein